MLQCDDLTRAYVVMHTKGQFLGISYLVQDCLQFPDYRQKDLEKTLHVESI